MPSPISRAIAAALLAAGPLACAGPAGNPAVVEVPSVAAEDGGAPAPEEKEPRRPTRAKLGMTEITLTQPIHFATDSADLRPESVPVVDDVAALLVSRFYVTVEIVCSCDARGNRAFVASLVARRAESLRQRLIRAGVAEDRLTARGDCKSYPTSHPSEEELQKLRRCDLVRTDRR